MGHHDHGHGHDHGHHHHGPSASKSNRKRLLLVLVLAGGYMIAEIIGGVLSNSLALLADAGHMFSDVASLALSCFAIWLADRPAGTQRTYGFYRAEILAAFINGATLVAVALLILKEAWERMSAPPEVAGALMMWIAVGGLAVNIAGLVILHSGRDENLNVRGAWLHVLSDALGSVGAITAGLMIHYGGWHWADPVMSAIIAVLVIHSSWRLLKDAVWILMEGAPSNIDVDEVRASLESEDGVASVHDLHVWTITSGLDSLSCHVVSDDTRSYSDLLRVLRTKVHDQFGIDHVTIQIEPLGFTEPETPI
jgi:cobalt-zinc-cadmium efflux system protein